MFADKIVSESDITKFLKRFQSFHPKLIDLSLDRVARLLDLLDNPEQSLPPIVHIAGTNGKGSTLSYIKSGLEADSKIVHTYTSPHLIKFNERICIKGKEITDETLIHYFSQCDLINKNSNITLFEITTCAAFLAFNDFNADFTLLEVGLGGKFDATNVVKNPTLTIITPISLDHEQFLGKSIVKITEAKAGILKPNTPAIIGKQEEKALNKICAVAKKINSRLLVFGRDWVSYKNDNKLIFEDNEEVIELSAPSLAGEHQFENAGIAVAALKYLNVSKNSINEGIEKALWPARLQKINSGPFIRLLKQSNFNGEIWVDGGHNKSAAEAISKFLKSEGARDNHIICGMINSKDINGFLESLSHSVMSVTAITIPNEKNSYSSEEIYKSAQKFFNNCYTAKSLKVAIEAICKKQSPKTSARIVICGSLYLSGYVLREHS